MLLCLSRPKSAYFPPTSQQPPHHPEVNIGEIKKNVCLYQETLIKESLSSVPITIITGF